MSFMSKARQHKQRVSYNGYAWPDRVQSCCLVLLFINWNQTQLYPQRVHFRQLPVLRWLWFTKWNWNPVPRSVSLANLAFQPYKTWNPAPTSNLNSRFPPLFSAKILNITEKKGKSRILPDQLETLVMLVTSYHSPKANFILRIKLLCLCFCSC